MYNKSILTGCLLLLAVMLAGCSQPPTSKPNHMITCTWNKLPDLPGMADTASLGVSAPFVGISNGMLLVAGGCNFPDKPVTEGGAKRYYSDIFALDLSDKNAQWQKAGNLPLPVAYGASVTTPEGIVCIGGNNSTDFLADVYCCPGPGPMKRHTFANWIHFPYRWIIFLRPISTTRYM